MVVTSALIVGLVACNNNEAMDVNENDQVGTMDVSDNFNYNGNRNYGPLTRVNNGNRNGENGLRIANRDNKNDLTNNDFDFDFLPDRNFNGKDMNNLTISSSKTDISSQNYPHTRAIAVQEAKFRTIQADTVEEARQQAEQFIQQQQQQFQGRAQAPIDQQPRAQAPTQQQPRAQAPTAQQQPTNEQQTQTQQPAQQQPAAKAPAEKKPGADQPAKGLSQAVQQVIDLTNAERRKNGLPNLTADTKLSGVAQKKSEDMRQNNYFSHTSPTYGSPFDMMRDFGVTYKTAGENIAQGQQTPQQVVQAWMNSEGHRKNILSKDFTHIGVGYDQNGHHWTQMFIGK
jgi:uncharacterized YkwD family protein